MNQASDIFKAIAVDVRRDLLAAMIGEDRTVRELTERVSISQSAVSQHLGVLKSAGLVRDRKVGRNRYYAVCIEQLLLLDDWLEPFREFWPAKLDALESQLARQKN
ncbi:MAG: metalloregulator ArsR/SmtB family transcription factor [Pseudomonadota bacterium]